LRSFGDLEILGLWLPNIFHLGPGGDPKFKFGPGFSEEDKNIIWNLLKEMLRLVAMSAVQVRVESEVLVTYNNVEMVQLMTCLKS
jgi:hypothetical protein